MTSAEYRGGFKKRVIGFGRKASRITRLVLTWILLGAVYLLIFFPARLVISLAGVDLLGRRRKDESYWRKIIPPRRTSSYRDWYS